MPCCIIIVQDNYFIVLIPLSSIYLHAHFTISPRISKGIIRLQFKAAITGCSIKKFDISFCVHYTNSFRYSWRFAYVRANNTISSKTV